MVEKQTYLKELTKLLTKAHPENRRINLVIHGHSQSCGYTTGHVVDPFAAYPHQLHRLLKHRFPMAVINVILSSIGGESAVSGVGRFTRDALCHQPDLLILDYALNDRFQPRKAVEAAWRKMTETAAAHDIPVLLLTPTLDLPAAYSPEKLSEILSLEEMIKGIAAEFQVAAVDVTACWQRYLASGGQIEDLLCSVNHASEKGHSLIAEAINSWIPSLGYEELH